MSVLELRDVSYTYQTQYQKVEALRRITASFDGGKTYAIVGKSGSGKTFPMAPHCPPKLRAPRWCTEPAA